MALIENDQELLAMQNDVSCPVDFVSVNENRVRLVALLVLTLGIAYLWGGLWFIIAFLVADFLLRSIKLNKYSVLFILAGWIINLFNIGNSPTDQAPKRFAARMGLVFNIVILIFHFLNLPVIVLILVLALCLFAFLESFLGLCVGCYIYSYWHKLFGN